MALLLIELLARQRLTMVKKRRLDRYARRFEFVEEQPQEEPW